MSISRCAAHNPVHLRALLLSISFVSGNKITLFFKKGDYCRALLHFENCLARYVRALGSDHPDTKGTRDWRDACKRRLASRLH
jgi:hypothetical protein